MGYNAHISLRILAQNFFWYMKWNDRLIAWAQKTINQLGSPLLLKELAWRGVVFVVKCGRSNPISFAIRPVLSHPKGKTILGMAIAMMVLATSIWGPIPTAADAGGRWELPVIPEGKISPVTVESVVLPVENFRISQGYGWLHSGVDMAAKKGEAVKSVMAGQIIAVKRERWGYGQHVIVGHKNGYESLYAHLSKISVAEGDRVTTDSVLGEVGSTGRSTGPHLHLEIRQEGKLVNPKTVLGMK